MVVGPKALRNIFLSLCINTMKHVLKYCLFQFAVILLFTFIYYSIKKDLVLPHKLYKTAKFVDCFALSVSITSGVGASGVVYNSPACMYIVSAQEALLVCTTALMVYYFYKLI